VASDVEYVYEVAIAQAEFEARRQEILGNAKKAAQKNQSKPSKPTKKK